MHDVNCQTPEESGKLRGGYYTPPELAAWLCRWAIRKPTDRVLEPSCGDGVFLKAAIDRFESVGLAPGFSIANRLKGIEVNPEEAEKARQRLNRNLGLCSAATVHSGDFFTWWSQQTDAGFDVVVGNPPFIRYRNVPEHYRSIAMEVLTKLGLKTNRLTNIWVPFVVAAAQSLRENGRLALILPAELLQVSYANQLRGFLVSKFSRIDIITCNQLLFDKAEQEIVLVLAEGARRIQSGGQDCRVTMTEFDTMSEITNRSPCSVLSNTQPKTVRHESEKWLKYMLTPVEIDLMRELRQSTSITNLGCHASIDVGVVTGKNNFFVMRRERLVELGLEEYTFPLISRSKQLKGAYIGNRDWATLDTSGEPVHLLHLAPLNGSTLSQPLNRYIKMGEDEEVDKGYKCSNRSPWYAVPSVWEPQGFFLRQIYHFPRIILNSAGATCTDTIHRLSCAEEPEKLITNTYTFLTGASAEIEGRSYGGGILALEPSEAERLLVPAQLAHAMAIEECDEFVREGRLGELLLQNSIRVLVNGVGLSKRDCDMLQGIWNKMGMRRRGRSIRRVSSRVS